MSEEFDKNHQTLSLVKRQRGRHVDPFLKPLDQLYSQLKPLAAPKINDFKSLLELVPIDCRPFFNALT
jgi:hypothetical protein